MSYKDDGMIFVDEDHGTIIDGKYKECILPPSEAVKVMTDKWIDDGQYCIQTVSDLRDALIDAQQKLKQAAAWFYEYELIHHNKGDVEKAKRNRGRGDYCFGIKK